LSREVKVSALRDGFGTKGVIVESVTTFVEAISESIVRVFEI
jgi:hypothetical protein